MRLNEKASKVTVIFRDHARIPYEGATVDYANRVIRVERPKLVLIPFEAVFAVIMEDGNNAE